MRWPLQMIMLAVLAGVYAACSPVMFEKDADCGVGCVRVNGMKEIEYTVGASGGKVDILFVDDNSGSMSFEQNNIAARFSSFLSALDAKQVDYRIGVITTDVSGPNNGPRAINGNGALQDGRLIAFSNGQYFLEKGTANKEALFAGVIRRGETLTCENYLNSGSSQNASAYAANCPSPDERGIYAASLTVESNPSGFIRAEGSLAIVFLSDEDVRSLLYEQSPAYRLNDRDLPQTLIQIVQNRFPGKSLSMHSIIVRPGELKSGYSAADVAQKISQVITGDYNISVNAQNRPENFFYGADISCLNQQGSQTNQVSGSQGYLYYLAAKMTGGVVGDICANNYGSQLSAIGTNIGEKVNQIALACENPKILDLRFTNQSGAPTGSVQGSNFVFNPELTSGQTVYLKIECPDNM
ncbi:MAG: VWA domain-containing protein [Bdellovibrionaceae bacterium]|nr:VWA domain-containing protein [Pseudobdellovibrionaceae bacterium]